jgi:hypothetical protein
MLIKSVACNKKTAAAKEGKPGSSSDDVDDFKLLWLFREGVHLVFVMGILAAIFKQENFSCSGVAQTM